MCCTFVCSANGLAASACFFFFFYIHTNVNGCGCTLGLYGHRKLVCTDCWLWEKNPLPRWGARPASAGCWTQCSASWATVQLWVLLYWFLLVECGFYRSLVTQICNVMSPNLFYTYYDSNGWLICVCVCVCMCECVWVCVCVWLRILTKCGRVEICLAVCCQSIKNNDNRILFFRAVPL